VERIPRPSTASGWAITVDLVCRDTFVCTTPAVEEQRIRIVPSSAIILPSKLHENNLPAFILQEDTAMATVAHMSFPMLCPPTDPRDLFVAPSSPPRPLLALDHDDEIPPLLTSETYGASTGESLHGGTRSSRQKRSPLLDITNTASTRIRRHDTSTR
jgi:hypothetical protein